LGAAKRTLDGEDRSEMIAEEGKAGRKIGEKWSAILVASPAASNTLGPNLDIKQAWCRPRGEQIATISEPVARPQHGGLVV
jgi:hypothetical protein